MQRAPWEVWDELCSWEKENYTLDLLKLEDVPVCLFCCEVTQSYRIWVISFNETKKKQWTIYRLFKELYKGLGMNYLILFLWLLELE